jgi:penicillin-binding protein 1A
VDHLFETGKKASRRPLGFLLGLLRFAFNAGLVLLVGTLVAASAGYAYVVWQHDDALSRRYPDLAENSIVYDVDGRRMGEFEAAENRRTVGPEDLGEYLPDAVVAIEDKRFYGHPGLDPRGIARAAYTDLRTFTVSQGGSTITEQLTKNLFIEPERRGEISPWRRFEQAALAVSYERRHTKGEVLTAYLNTVYFGEGAYGAEEAAETYFGKPARELSLPEAAALAGFLHAPSAYLSDGRKGAERAQARRDEVLEKMREAGAISPREERAAKAQPLGLSPERPPAGEEAYEPFLDQVRREVEERLGEGAIEHGGLRIHTTMRPDLQRDAVDSVEESLPYDSDPAGAIATVEPRNGAIRAIAGEEGDFNLALDARRQPGSAFKPFVLVAALREYVSPETLYDSHDLKFPWNGERVEVENYGSIVRGPITLEEAMEESDNTIFVQLAMDLGLKNVVRAAKDLGVRSEVDPFPSTAIGGLGTGVSVLEMSSAYATLAAGGVYREPYAVERMDRVGFGERENVYEHRVRGRRVLNEEQAAVATEVLRGVVEEGTASRFHDLDAELGRPSAGKTGTTDDFVDAWYVGYTPQLSTAVWIGYPEGRRPMLGVHGLPEVNGENLPLDLWSLYMARATRDTPARGFPEPDESRFEVSTRGRAVSPYDSPPAAYASAEQYSPAVNPDYTTGYGGG